MATPALHLSIEGATTALDTAKRSVQELQDRVSHGDSTVTGADLAAARADVDLAELRLTSAHKAAEDARAAAHLTACQALHDEIATAHAATPQLAELLRAADNHLRAFIDAARQHNAFVGNALHRMHGLDIPQHNLDTAPATERAGLGFTRAGDVIAGTLRLATVDAERWVALIARAALTEGASNPPYLRHISEPPGGHVITDVPAALVAQAALRRKG
ncbi:hypothetical protein [Streptomyces sp. NPDC003688]